MLGGGGKNTRDSRVKNVPAKGVFFVVSISEGFFDEMFSVVSIGGGVRGSIDRLGGACAGGG